MSKWRPSPSCLYVISDIHGMLDEFEVILKRILPLRSTGGVEDKLILLGDYIDRRIESHLLIDRLIELKKEYPVQIKMLRGNHEQMLLNAMEPSPNSFKYLLWMRTGGDFTLSGYLKRAGENYDNPYKIMRSRLSSLVPKDHIEFLKNLDWYFEYDDYIFVHAGCDPMDDVRKQDKEVLIWDRSLFKFVLENKNSILEWNKKIVTGHNSLTDGKLIIHDKFLMLDRSLINEVLVLELNSMSAMIAKRGKKRLIKIDLEKERVK